MTSEDEELDKLLDQARVVSPHRQPRHAERINREILQRRPNNSVSYLRLARALQAQFRFGDARQACERAIQLSEADEEPEISALISERVGGGNNDCLDELLHQARHVLPESHPYGAEAINREIIARRPNDSASYLRLARALQAQSRFGAARQTCERAVALSPRGAAPRNRLQAIEEGRHTHHGECNVLAKVIGEQCEFETLARRCSTFQDALNAAMELRESGPIALRFVYLWRAAAMAQDESQGLTALISLAATYRDLKESDALHRAEDMYWDILRRQPSNSAALTGMAGVLRSLDRLDEARASYERVLSRNPSDVAAMVGLGAVLRDIGFASKPRDAGQLVAAESLFRRALELKPKDRFALTGLAGLLKALGRGHEAIQLLPTAEQGVTRTLQ